MAAPVHTWAMSSSITDPTDAISRPPIKKTGVSMVMPHRKPNVSPIQPTNGITSRPGSTHRAPTEKPIDRARGGIASDRLARTPGPTMTSEPAIRQLMITATTMFGAHANPADSSEARAEA